MGFLTTLSLRASENRRVRPDERSVGKGVGCPYVGSGDTGGIRLTILRRGLAGGYRSIETCAFAPNVEVSYICFAYLVAGRWGHEKEFGAAGYMALRFIYNRSLP